MNKLRFLLKQLNQKLLGEVVDQLGVVVDQPGVVVDQLEVVVERKPRNLIIYLVV